MLFVCDYHLLTPYLNPSLRGLSQPQIHFEATRKVEEEAGFASVCEGLQSL